MSVFSSKSKKVPKGDYVWLIAGLTRDGRTSYHLAYCFVVEHSVVRGSKRITSGRVIQWFEPKLEITKRRWFPEFLRYMGNFGRGLSPIRPKDRRNFLNAVGKLPIRGIPAAISGPDAIATRQSAAKAEHSRVTRVRATDLQRIRLADLRGALDDFDTKTTLHSFEESTQFDLLIEGHRRYPPKAIVGLAGRRVFGRTLAPADFAGGESSAAFRLLWENGFEIVTKPRQVGALDTAFSVGRSKNTDFLILESRGPEQNTDYHLGLQSLLHTMALLDATLTDIYIDSERTRALPIAKRRLAVIGMQYPLQMRRVEHPEALRRSLTAAAAATGRSVETDSGGNPSNRLRLEFALSEELALADLAASFAQGDESAVPATSEFHFRPSGPQDSSDDATRNAVEPTVVTHIHAMLQTALYERLVARHGKDNVAAEQVTCSGRPADLVVQKASGYEIYEIKTALGPRDCVRQALGQLLEYTCWPGSPRYEAMWVVGPSAGDATTEEYITTLRERFSLPLAYLHQPPDRE